LSQLPQFKKFALPIEKTLGNVPNKSKIVMEHCKTPTCLENIEFSIKMFYIGYAASNIIQQGFSIMRVNKYYKDILNSFDKKDGKFYEKVKDTVQVVENNNTKLQEHFQALRDSKSLTVQLLILNLMIEITQNSKYQLTTLHESANAIIWACEKMEREERDNRNKNFFSCSFGLLLYFFQPQCIVSTVASGVLGAISGVIGIVNMDNMEKFAILGSKYKNILSELDDHQGEIIKFFEKIKTTKEKIEKSNQLFSREEIEALDIRSKKVQITLDDLDAAFKKK